MSFLSDRTYTFLQYLFAKKTVMIGTKTKTVCEVGQQKLRLSAINMRPMKETQCMFILEFLKDKHIEEVYVPIVIEYTVSIKNGPDEMMTRLINLIRMAFKETLDVSKNLPDVYTQLARLRGRYVNAVVKHKSTVVQEKGRVVYDDSVITKELFGKNEPKTDRSAYIARVRHIDRPYQSYEINYYTLIDPPKDPK